jgi:DnaJ-class molecular chaperone
MMVMQTVCEGCQGQGTKIKDFCPSCKGNGTQQSKAYETITIPRGI